MPHQLSLLSSLNNINVSGCDYLEYLSLHGASIKSLDISNNKRLRYLTFCDCGELSDIMMSVISPISKNSEISKCEKLENIYCPDAKNIDDVKLRDTACHIYINNNIDEYEFYNGKWRNVISDEISLLGIRNSEEISLQVGKPSNVIISDEDETQENDTVVINKINEWVSVKMQKDAKIRVTRACLTKLDCSNTSIEIVSGLMPKVTELNTSNCIHLLEIKLVSHEHIYGTQFKYRDINNDLQDLNVVGCSKLERLICRNSSLSSLDLSNCISLKYLDCSNAPLLSINIENCNSLERLEVSNAIFSNLDISEHSSITLLGCYNCPNLKFLNVKNCRNLRSVSTQKCTSLDSLNVFGCSSLNSLSLSETKLKFLNISSCTLISSLYCDNCVVLDSIDIPKGEILSKGLNLKNCSALSNITCCSALNFDEVSSVLKDKYLIQQQCSFILGSGESYRYVTDKWVKQ